MAKCTNFAHNSRSYWQHESFCGVKRPTSNKPFNFGADLDLEIFETEFLPAPLGWWVVDPRNTRLSHMRYHAEAHRSRSKIFRRCFIAGTLPFGIWASEPLGIHPSTTCYCAKFGHSRSNNMSVSVGKLHPSRPTFQGHSRSSKLTRTNWLPKQPIGQSVLMTLSDLEFLLVFHDNHRPILYRFQGKWQFP